MSQLASMMNTLTFPFLMISEFPYRKRLFSSIAQDCFRLYVILSKSVFTWYWVRAWFIFQNFRIQLDILTAEHDRGSPENTWVANVLDFFVIYIMKWSSMTEIRHSMDNCLCFLRTILRAIECRHNILLLQNVRNGTEIRTIWRSQLYCSKLPGWLMV